MLKLIVTSDLNLFPTPYIYFNAKMKSFFKDLFPKDINFIDL